MGIIIRQGFKSSVLTFIGTIVGVVNVLFIYNTFLSQEQLGLYASALVSFTVFFSSFSQLGVIHTAVRYFSYFTDNIKAQNSFLFFMLVTGTFGLLLFSLAYLLLKPIFYSLYTDTSPLLVQYYYYILPITGFSLYFNLLEAYARINLRIAIPTLIREVMLRLLNSIMVICFGCGLISFDQLVGSTIFVQVVGIIALVTYIKFLGKLNVCIDLHIFSSPLFKEMSLYGLWVLLGGMCYTLGLHLERIMLPAYQGGLNSTAIFDIASRIAAIIAIPRNNIAAISAPIMAQAWKKNDIKRISSLYNKSSLTLLIIGLFFFLLVWCNVDAIFSILPKSDIYSQGKWVVFIFGMSKVIDMGTGLNSEILLNSKYYRFDLLFYFILIVSLITLNNLLIPTYSFNGAALATMLATLIYNVVKFIFIYVKINIQPFSIQTLKVILLATCTFLLINLLPDSSGFILTHCHNLLLVPIFSILIKSMLIVLIFGGAILYFQISDEISGLCCSIIHFLSTSLKKNKAETND